MTSFFASSLLRDKCKKYDPLWPARKLAQRYPEKTYDPLQVHFHPLLLPRKERCTEDDGALFRDRRCRGGNGERYQRRCIALDAADLRRWALSGGRHGWRRRSRSPLDAVVPICQSSRRREMKTSISKKIFRSAQWRYRIGGQRRCHDQKVSCR